MRVALIASFRSITLPFVSSQESPMELRELVQHLPGHATFRADKMAKIDCYRSERLLVGLNCFERGQAQPVHTHTDADKFYVVVSGKATFVVGERVVTAGPGDLVLAPAGVPHGVEHAETQTVVLMAMAPPPPLPPSPAP